MQHEQSGSIQFNKLDKHFQAIFYNASLGIAITNTKYEFVLVNDAYCALTGYTRDELYGRTLQQITVPEDLPLKLKRLKELQEGTINNFEIKKRYYHKGGNILWVHNHVSRILDNQGNPESIISISRDITREVELEMEQQKLLALIENSAEYMSVGDPAGKMIYINPRGRELLGIGPDEDITRYNSNDFYPPYYYEEVKRFIIPEIMKTGKWSGTIYAKHFVTGETIPCHAEFTTILHPTTKEIIGRGATIRDIRPEIAARKALAESERKLKQITSSAPVALWMTDTRGNFIYVNETWMEWTGEEEQAHYGTGWVNSILPHERKEVLEDLQNCVQQQKHFSKEFSLRSKDGKIRICIASGDPYFHADGKFAGFAGYCSDITERLLTARQLEESEKRFRDLVESAPMPIGVYTGKEMRITLANKSILETWGKGANVIGRTYAEVLPELAGTGIYEQLDQVFTTGEAYHANAARVDLVKNGSLQTFYFNYMFDALRDGNGQIYGVLNTAADVTELVNARQTLAHTQDILKGAVELAELGTWELDIQKETVIFNHRVAKWFGLKSNVAPAFDFLETIHEKDRERVLQAAENAVSPGSNKKYDEEYTVVNHETGKEYILHAQATVFYDESGNPKLLRGTAIDITNQKNTERALELLVQERTEELQAAHEEAQATNEELASINEELNYANEQLQQSNQELERFAFVASHDLQEPLRKIKMFAGMLEAKMEAEKEEQKNFLGKIMHSAERMSLLMNDILQFSRVNTEARDWEEVNLNDTLNDVLTDFDSRISRTQAQIISEDLGSIKGIAFQIRQLFLNLLGNGLKFARKDIPPVLHISSRLLFGKELTPFPRLHRNTTYREIRFTDNGIGFSQEYAEQIFELFQRLNSKHEYEGTGIGLAICLKIVLHHQGHIYAESSEGKGSTFIVLLPTR